MSDRLTPFGAKCREFRSRYGMTMGDQAKVLGLSVPYISAIELGKRPIPDGLSNRFAEWLSLSEGEARQLECLAETRDSVVKISTNSREQTLLARDFARHINDLSQERVRELRELLTKSTAESYSAFEVATRAALARAVFEIGKTLGFDILRVAENRLPDVDPDFYLEVVPDGAMKGNLQIYSDSDGKRINRMVCSEWFYRSVYRETPETRFILAHELGHWMLHRSQPHTFLRTRGKIVSQFRIEADADRFAREFLLPYEVVERFSVTERLAREAKVPLNVARRRVNELGLLSEGERLAWRELGIQQDKTGSIGGKEELKSSPSKPPSENRSEGQRLLKRTKKSTISLPLFDFADKVEAAKPARSRQDAWYDEYGWRG